MNLEESMFSKENLSEDVTVERSLLGPGCVLIDNNDSIIVLTPGMLTSLMEWAIKENIIAPTVQKVSGTGATGIKL